MNSLKKLLKVLTFKQKRNLILISLMSISTAFLDLFGLGATFYFVSLILNPEKIFDYPLLKDTFTYFNITNVNSITLILSIIIVVSYLLKTIYFLFFNRVKIDYNYSIINSIKRELFNKYIRNQYSFHIHRNVSDLLKVMQITTEDLKNFFIAPIVDIFCNVSILLIIISFIILVDPLPFSLMFITIFLFSFLFMKKNNKKVKSYSEQRNSIYTKLNKIILESLGSIRELKLLCKEQITLERYNKCINVIRKTESYVQVIIMAPRHLLEFIIVCFVIIFIVVLLYIDQKPDQILAKLSILGLSAMRLIPIISILNSHFSCLRYGRVALDKIYMDLIGEGYTTNTVNKGNIEVSFKKSIQFKEVSFSYNKGKTVLNALDLEIFKGKSIAFVGPSGSGKSTTIDVLLGLLYPNKGEVLLDGIQISKYKNYGSLFGYIPQQIYLSDASVAENIAYYLDRSDINYNRVNEVLKQVELYDFVQNLPHKEHAIVGQQGVKLSGGQRQRIGIARALYNNPEILVMDEATAALDNITEAKIINTFKRFNEKTIIFVAHRLSTIEHCDIIHVIDKGNIVNSGTYKELSEKSPLFKEMIKMNVE